MRRFNLSAQITYYGREFNSPSQKTCEEGITRSRQAPCGGKRRSLELLRSSVLKTTQILSEAVVYPLVLILYRAFPPTLEPWGWARDEEEKVNQEWNSKSWPVGGSKVHLLLCVRFKAYSLVVIQYILGFVPWHPCPFCGKQRRQPRPAAELEPGLIERKQAKEKEEIAPEEQLLWEKSRPHANSPGSCETCFVLLKSSSTFYSPVPWEKKKLQ